MTKWITYAFVVAFELDSDVALLCPLESRSDLRFRKTPSLATVRQNAWQHDQSVLQIFVIDPIGHVLHTPFCSLPFFPANLFPSPVSTDDSNSQWFERLSSCAQVSPSTRDSFPSFFFFGCEHRIFISQQISDFHRVLDERPSAVGPHRPITCGRLTGTQ